MTKVQKKLSPPKVNTNEFFRGKAVIPQPKFSSFASFRGGKGAPRPQSFRLTQHKG